jgi:hypothetical protein
MLEDKHDSHVVVIDKYHDPNATYFMTVRDYVVRVTCTAHLGIILPPVAEAKGRFYSIIVRAVTPGQIITIYDRNDSECWIGGLSLNAKCDGVLLYSDGLLWTVVSEHGSVPQLSTEAPTTPTGRQSTAAPTTTAPTTVEGTTVVPTT